MTASFTSTYAKLRNHVIQNLELYILLALALIGRVFYLFGFTRPFDYIASDMAAYNNQGLDLAAGRTMGIPPYQSGLYDVTLGILFKLAHHFQLQDYQLFWLILINCTVGVMSIWFVYWIAREFLNTGLSLLVAGLMAIWYPLIHINVFILNESLFIPLFLGGLYLWLTRRQTSLNLCLTVLVWTLACGYRPYFLAFVAMWVLYILFAKKFRWQAKAIVFFTCLAVFLSLIGINYSISQGQSKFLAASGGVNFALTWCDYTGIEYQTNQRNYSFYPPAHSWEGFARVHKDTVDFLDNSYYYKLGYDCLKANPARLFYQLRSIPNLFYSVYFPRTGSVVGEGLWLGFFRWLTILFFVLGLVGLFGSLAKDSRHYWIMAIFATLFVTIYIQNPGEERYLIPMMPLIILYGVIGVEKLHELFVKRISPNA